MKFCLTIVAHINNIYIAHHVTPMVETSSLYAHLALRPTEQGNAILMRNTIALPMYTGHKWSNYFGF